MFESYLIHYVGLKVAHRPSPTLPHSTFRVIGYQIYYIHVNEHAFAMSVSVKCFLKTN